MLAMTDAAAEAINALTAQEGKEETGGLRFAVQRQEEAGAQLALSVARRPEDGDQVVDEHGARVFLEPQAAQFLDDKVLDVQQDDQGQLSFAVMPQPGGPV
ncbi:iron-sulfur cluster biosynthesis protein [Amycolatopsis cynarae]|uniref:Iron-sulfur cluster biosynthesis protein n=1 Tax=Amycolatopsis cynarae TaxID=2995223 RepID=A0ABY7BCB6_9PSEU|nr:iron-sulfur cluster biosynthesis family protein [Amycolatopsis sp. HUAS 11-8]WAL69612.1 iron-sulfur cluster biosynthesis protein [Amycolatopsis sp. HUAS 11-8]